MHGLSYGQTMNSIVSRTLVVLAVTFALFSTAHAQKSPHGPLSIACTDCHTTKSWKELARPMKFSHAVTGFSLDGQHGNVACLQCHTTKKFSGTPTTCFSCHQKDFVRAFTPNHQLGKFSRECLTCHTLTAWKPSIFQHSKTNFQLTGNHQSVDCASCHTNNKFLGLSHDCFYCHQRDFTSAISPNHVQGRFTHTCLTCHTMNGWKPAAFDHAKTNFPLVGVHRAIECSGCHAGGKYTALPTDCYSCHQKDFAKVVTPNHLAAQFSRECLTCHSINGWKPATFDHSKTDFALVGAHAGTECSSCHSTGQFKGLTKDCFTCHTADFNKVKQPSHSKAQFDHNCLACHNLVAWSPSTFDHAKTSYPLLGAHKNADCASCHSSGVYKGLNTECYTCHQTNYKKAVAPNHQTAQLSHDCVSCHSPNGWKPSSFNHAKTNFPLVGAHTSADCASCHSAGRFIGLPGDCFSCHQKDFGKTVAPNHTVAQFSHDCLTCHTVIAWKPSTFSHAKTNFQLVGAHVTVACESCHKNGVFKGLPSDCYSCHQTNFNTTTSPNHVAAQFSHDCMTCHSTIAWKPSTFNHATTNFQLVGAHVTVACESCHKNGVYKGLPSDCYSCHQTNFNATTSPNHATAQFSHDCMTCHSTIAWKPSTFNHATTNFQLVGAHVTVACESCHKNGVFKGLSSDCYSCHQTNFNATTSPNHATAQFSHDCMTCHSTIAWKPSTFNHATTNFQLVGAHVSLACESCHKNGVFKGLPSDCYSCHQTNFNGVTNPNHVTAQFSHDCITCHSTTVWKPSTFSHANTAFPLLGAHAAVLCGDCHKNGVYKGTTTDCYTCHLTDFNATATPSHVTSQFSHTCLTCHSMTAWKPATFNHSTTAFPLIGTHVTASCVSCHKNGVYKGTTTDCYVCHLTDYNGAKVPDHVAGQYNTAHVCTFCHGTIIKWQPWTFNHIPSYPYSTNRHSAVKCAQCHFTPGTFLTFSCTTGCHSGAHNKTRSCLGSGCHPSNKTGNN